MRKSMFGACLLILASCTTEARNQYGPGTDPVWAAQAERVCLELHPRSVRAYNQCLIDMAEYD